MNRHIASIFFMQLAVAGACLAGDFIPDDQTVSDPSVDLIDPEFDSVEDRMVWQDRDGNLWIADIDPDTGDLIPNTGMGQMLDTGLPNLFVTGNGPEWGYGNGKVLIAYTKLIAGKRALGLAFQTTAGDWIAGPAENNGSPGERWRPLSTHPGTVERARVSYIREFPDGQVGMGWRDANDASTERGTLLAGSSGGRWAEGERAFVTVNKVNDIFQVFWVDIDTEEVTQITDGPRNILNAIVWLAPEYNDQVISANIDGEAVGIFRRIDGVWTQVNTITLPSSRPFIGSPEPFVHADKSYVTMIASEGIGIGPWPYFPTGSSEVWIAGIDPETPFARRIDDGEDGPVRTEPESYKTNNGTVIYYMMRDPDTGNALARRADTGLGPHTMPDSDGDGVADAVDNCLLSQNPPQRDTDGDGIGNACDADLDGDCSVNFVDLGIMKSVFFMSDSDADLDGDGAVNFVDLGIMKASFFQPPGPSGVPNICDGS